MVNVDVANRTQHVNVGLVLLRHGILDVHETVERFLDVCFVGEGLRDHNDEASFDQFIAPQIVVVKTFA